MNRSLVVGDGSGEAVMVFDLMVVVDGRKQMWSKLDKVKPSLAVMAV